VNFGEFLWSLVVIFFMVLFFMVFFMVIMDLFRDHAMNGWAKAAWIFFLILFPPITLLVYVIVRGPGMAKRQAEDAQKVQDAQQAYVDSMVQKAGGGKTPTEQIADAKQLLDSGAITQQEFDALKAKALA
jgi:hypothetical protein